MRFAIIGGTGVYDLGFLTDVRDIEIQTPYGPARVVAGGYRQQEIAFVSRHGRDHSVPPHRVNYRALIWALKSLGVQCVVATNAVGSCNSGFRVGDYVLVDQFIDLTKSRPLTFFDGGQTPVVHADITYPYCPTLRQALLSQAKLMGAPIHAQGCYVCFEGPRYETAAEVRMAAILGGDVLGMTGVPEVVLAREAGICYASVCIVTNMGAGLTGNTLSHDEVAKVVKERMGFVRRLAVEALVSAADKACCQCSTSKVALPGLQES